MKTGMKKWNVMVAKYISWMGILREYIPHGEQNDDDIEEF